MTRAKKSLLGRIALALGSTLGALLVAEIALRILGIAPARWAHPRHLETADKRHVLDAYPDDPRGYFPIDLRDAAVRRELESLGFGALAAETEQTPYAIHSVYTEGLCRGARIPERVPGTTRILAVGDSFVEGQGVREEDTFAAVLGRSLPHAQVIDCGRRGYDFPDLRDWALHHLDTDPDVVVYGMTLNDFEQSPSFHARQRYVDDWIVDRRRTVSEGDGAPPPLTPRLFALLEDRLEGARIGAETTQWYLGMVGPDNRDGFERTIDDIEAMARAAGDRGARFVVVLWPLLIDLDGGYPFEPVHRAVADALRARGIPFRDALPAFRGQDPERLWVHATDRHPNELAHARFAAVVEDALEPLLVAARGGAVGEPAREGER